jgi:hypothetical protein
MQKFHNFRSVTFSKTVADLKIKFPSLHQNLRNILANEMDQVCREEKFLKEEPDRLETALRRCKKLTGTLVTLKRLAWLDHKVGQLFSTNLQLQIGKRARTTVALCRTASRRGTPLGRVHCIQQGKNNFYPCFLSQCGPWKHPFLDVCSFLVHFGSHSPMFGSVLLNFIKLIILLYFG